MRLTWYIIRLHIGPFLFGTFTVVFIFLLQFIFKNLNILIGKGLSYWVIGKFILYSLGWMLVLAVPMGVLVATLMAYGKLSGNNELTIIKSSGGSAFRAMLPAIVGGTLLFLGLYIFNDRVLPETNHKAMVMQMDIKELQPTFAIEPGQFTTLQGYSILARQVDRARNMLHNVTIYAQDMDKMNTISARSADMAFNSDMSKLLMTLHQGEIQQVSRRDLTKFTKISFEEYQISISLSGYTLRQTDATTISRNDRTMNIAEMQAIADTATAAANRAQRKIDTLLARQFNPVDTTWKAPQGRVSRQEAATIALSKLASITTQILGQSETLDSQQQRADQFWVEIHKKYSIPAACLIFVFVGAPLGIVVRRGNFGVSAAIALGFFVIYWACLVAGEKLADRAALSPAVAMWMADAVIGVMGLYLTILVSRETVTFTFDFNRLRRLFRRKGNDLSST